MTNECLSCRKNCCDNFLISKDLIDENWWENEGKFILKFFKKNYITGRFWCENFDNKNGICCDYEHRPNICRNTGKNGNYPNNKCLLKNREMARV